MISKGQRDYLTKPPEESDIEPRTQAERNHRYKIRESVKEALNDFDILLEHAENRDIERIFRDPELGEDLSKAEIRKAKHQKIRAIGEREIEKHEYAEFPDETPPMNNIPSVIGFLYLGTITEQATSTRKNPFENDPRLFEALVEKGIRYAYASRLQLPRSVDVSIDVEEGPTADELDTEKLASYSSAELGLLLDADEISFDEFLKAIDTKDE